MTGDVPYYGGRFTPAQAYAASHPTRSQADLRAAPPRQPMRTAGNPAETLRALQQLFEAGVLTEEEYGELRARVSS
jgi:hypothetical protein